MKKLHYGAVICLFLSILFISSCRKTDSTNPTSSDPLDKFVGSWQIHDDQTATVSGHRTKDYTVTVTKSSKDGFVLFKNFDGESGNSVSVSVSGSSFTIPQQVLSDGTSASVTGSGSINGNSISFSYATICSAMWGGNANATCT